MTVEQSPLEHYYSTNQGEARTKALLHLKEITGVEDSHILDQALEASKTEGGKYDLDQAVSMVMDEQPKPTRAFEMGEQTTLGIEGPAQQDTTDAVIDLTNEVGTEKEDDLEKAIALSLQEQHGVLGNQVTMEEQDISRVLEASLAESKAVGTKRKRGEVWQDPINPHERERKDDWPVGLKNIGNTCWFAAVIQSLFHLPDFIHLVLNFKPNVEWTSDMCSTKRRNVVFMQELRKLFALMLCSHREYVDPSPALEIWREAFPNSTDNQQDVSEFSHKLIEWLEEAYKFDTSRQQAAGSLKEEIPNPMTTLFYGRSKCEGQNEGHIFSNDANFGLYPLTVNGYNDIHESLEAAVAHEIDSNNAMSKSGQETWFTQIPPILHFELSRFHFNQKIGMPEKIHNKLHFPEVIYMDRYLETNKELIRKKRDQVRKLKENRKKLYGRLQKYLNYGSVPKRVPLRDILQCALEFVESGAVENSNSSNQDIEMTSPANSSGSLSDTPKKGDSDTFSVLTSPSMCSREVNDGPSSSVQCITPIRGREIFSSRPNNDLIPAPRYISDSELNIFQSCLKRWRTEVENDVKDLQDQIGIADQSIRDIYNESVLQKFPYQLHAVLVHEGQAASGHYWSYVRCPKRKLWLKFNDARVTEATWSELQKDSIGGETNASAYCLVYVDQHLPFLQDNSSPHTLENLPEDLLQYVRNDNSNFDKEICKWDSEQSYKKEATTMTSGQVLKNIGAGEHARSTLSPTTTVQFAPHIPALHLDHALLTLSEMKAKIEILSKRCHNQPIKKILETGISTELIRLNQVANTDNSTTEDVRLQNIGIYLIKNRVAEEFIRLILLEQFSHKALVNCCNSLGKQLRLCALEELDKSIKNMNESNQKKFGEWHIHYEDFRKVVTLFVNGIEKYQENAYKKALPYFLKAYSVNKSIVKSSTEYNKGFNQHLIAYYRRKCLLYLNETAAQYFLSDSNFNKVLFIMNELVLPSMAFFDSEENNSSNFGSNAISTNSNFALGANCFFASKNTLNFFKEAVSEDEIPLSDSLTAIQIRDCWFSMLGKDHTDQKREKLQEFLNELMEQSTDSNVTKKPITKSDMVLFYIEDLNGKFRETISHMEKSKDYNEFLRLCGGGVVVISGGGGTLNLQENLH